MLKEPAAATEKQKQKTYTKTPKKAHTQKKKIKNIFLHNIWKKPFVSSNPIILYHLSVTAILNVTMRGQLGRKYGQVRVFNLNIQSKLL